MSDKVGGHTIESEQFLGNLTSDATAEAEKVLNPHWKRAYLALADAADRLHAMTMRTMVKE